MRLKKLHLRNFKGLHDYTFEPGGKDAFVFGENGSGKTSIADAMSFLLFDKDSLGQSTFEIKPKNYSHIEVEVEGSFVNGDTSVILKKIYREVYTKKRGSVQVEFTGHATDYYVNDVPVTMGEYKAKVAEIATREDVFRILTSPIYFNELMPDTKVLRAWQRRRQFLFEVSGKNYTDEQIIAANPALSDLPGILNGKAADDYKKIVMASRKKINEAIEGIPARIDEQMRSKPELTVANPQAIIDKLLRLRFSLDNKNQEIAKVSAGGGIAELQTKIAVIDGEIQTIINEHKNSLAAKVQGYRDDLSVNRDRLAELRRSLQALTAQTGNDEAELKTQTETIAALKADWKRIKAEIIISECCPTCGQSLPASQIETAMAQFNSNKAKALEENLAKGKSCAAKIAELTASIEQSQGKTADLKNSIEGAELVNSELSAKISGIEEDAAAGGDILEAVAAYASRDELVKQIESIKSGSSATTDKLTAEKTAIETDIIEQEKLISKIEQCQQADTRIAELKAEEKQLSISYATLEKHLFLIESFIRAKCSMLEESINSKFSIIKWRLFRDQINGGIEEICEASINGVGYGSANHAARINAGLECVQVFGDYYNFHPVIFVDGRESVTELPAMTAQVISLVVSPADKKLRVEVAAQ